MAAQPFDWSSYFTLANELAAKGDEASRRSAISRAYYFVYHLAHARATQNGCQFEMDQPAHKQLWQQFGDSVEPACVKLAEIGKRLKEKRERADYVATFPRLNDDVAALISDAQDFAQRLKALPARYPLPRNARR